eukprot:scaffold1223_cov380-Prasinococcus_capsulatus_cf.AAC.3
MQAAGAQPRFAAPVQRRVRTQGCARLRVRAVACRRQVEAACLLQTHDMRVTIGRIRYQISFPPPPPSAGGRAALAGLDVAAAPRVARDGMGWAGVEQEAGAVAARVLERPPSSLRRALARCVVAGRGARRAPAVPGLDGRRCPGPDKRAGGERSQRPAERVPLQTAGSSREVAMQRPCLRSRSRGCVPAVGHNGTPRWHGRQARPAQPRAPRHRCRCTLGGARRIFTGWPGSPGDSHTFGNSTLLLATIAPLGFCPTRQCAAPLPATVHPLPSLHAAPEPLQVTFQESARQRGYKLLPEPALWDTEWSLCTPPLHHAPRREQRRTP